MKLSLYTTAGDIAGTTYYRIYQYLDNDKYNIRKRQHLTNKMYSKWMPISSKGFIFKVYAFLVLFLRNFQNLLSDCIDPPQKLILSRGFLTRYLPYSYKVMILYLHWHNTEFIWDFDDDIISSKEFLRKDFDWFSNLASKIIVASEDNLEMIDSRYRYKAIVLPTTDRDMYKLCSMDLLNRRVERLVSEHRIIWVGSAISLPYLKRIMPAIEEYAKINNEVRVVMTVVCNKGLDYEPQNFVLRNVKWTRQVAIEEMMNSHIGLMPLEDSISLRRKGGFKLIQYLSIGLPIIGSPIGINDRIITSDVGIKASIEDHSAWTNGIKNILFSPEVYISYSNAAYKRWLKEYNYELNLESWNQIVETIYTD